MTPLAWGWRLEGTPWLCWGKELGEAVPRNGEQPQRAERWLQNLGDVQGSHPAFRVTQITMKAMAWSPRAVLGASTDPVFWGVLCSTCGLLPTSQTSRPSPGLPTKPAPRAHPAECALAFLSLAGHPCRLPHSPPCKLPRKKGRENRDRIRSSNRRVLMWGGDA